MSELRSKQAVGTEELSPNYGGSLAYEERFQMSLCTAAESWEHCEHTQGKPRCAHHARTLKEAGPAGSSLISGKAEVQPSVCHPVPATTTLAVLHLQRAPLQVKNMLPRRSTVKASESIRANRCLSGMSWVLVP